MIESITTVTEVLTSDYRVDEHRPTFVINMDTTYEHHIFDIVKHKSQSQDLDTQSIQVRLSLSVSTKTIMVRHIMILI